jgi:hypothetical protein
MPVVHVTDPAFCGNGGCPVVAFKRVSAGFELVGSSGLVRKPIYVLNERQAGWYSLAAVVGFGDSAGVVPIRYKELTSACSARASWIDSFWV